MATNTKIENSIFYSRRGNKAAWTAPNLLGRALAQVETHLGERDKRFTMLGVEIVPDTARCEIFFQTGLPRYVGIRIHARATESEFLSMWQIGHEALHCLDPASAATILEEGLAVYFQYRILSEHSREYPGKELSIDAVRKKYPLHGQEANYEAAYQDVLRLFAAAGGDAQALAALKALRTGGKTLSTITAQDLAQAIPGVPEELAQRLARGFS